MKMTVRVLDCFRLKSEFLPPSLASRMIYVRPGELEVHAEADQWEYVGRTFHPNSRQAADVERQGYCDRPLPSGFDWKRIARTWYNHPSSVR
jgi:hypothetical protein